MSVFLMRLGGVSCVKLASPVSESLSYSSWCVSVLSSASVVSICTVVWFSWSSGLFR